MRNLLALIGAVVVLVVGLGWYLEWYKLGTEPSEHGRQKITVDVNTDEITGDLKKARDAVGGILHHEKKVEGTTSGRNADGSWGVVPAVPTTLPKLPPPPTFAPIELNPDGTPKNILPPPPPPAFPK